MCVYTKRPLWAAGHNAADFSSAMTPWAAAVAGPEAFGRFSESRSFAVRCNSADIVLGAADFEELIFER